MIQRKKTFRLLIIEDQDDQWQLASRASGRVLTGASIVRLSNEEAVQHYFDECRVQDWQFPQLVLLDLYLPTRENGWAVLHAIRALPQPLCHVPVVIFSNSDQPDDIRKAYEHGCTSYLVKPASFDDWLRYFQTLKAYWIDTATLPQVSSVF